MLTETDLQNIAILIKASEVRTEGQIKASEERTEGRIKASEERMESLIKASEDRTEGRIKASEERMESLIRASEVRTESLIKASEERTDGRIKASEERMANLIAAEIGASHTATQRAIQASAETLLEQITRSTAEAIEASENRLLIAFHQWASPLETKVRAHSMAIGAFDGEKQNAIEQAKKIAELERRIAKLEKAS